MAEILIVDDSSMQRKALERMLASYGHTVFSAESGKEAIEKALEILPDLILMDIVMPEMNGFQATREITRQKFTQHIPIVLISGKSQDTDRKWGERQGAKGYLIKPIQQEILIEELDRCLAPTDFINKVAN